MSSESSATGRPEGPCVGPEMAQRALAAGEAKARLAALPTFILALLAGVYIRFGANFFTIVKTGNQLGFGLQQLLGGVAFSLGLMLVVVGGAELFTGNTLIVMAWLSGRVRLGALLRNWLIVYVGNFVGSVLLVWIVLAAGQHTLADGAVGQTAIKVAAAKCQLPFSVVFARGILCNALVCLAVWLCYSACSTTDKIAAIVLPITAFVAGGFEHCVANMYFVPMGIALGSHVVADGLAAGVLTWRNFLTANLIPSTVGNIVGGAVMVGGLYWVAYILPGLRPSVQE